MKLSSVLNPKLIRCGLAARSKDEALDELVRLMAEETPGVEAAELRAALTEREKLGPFSMAKGSAFPHARTERIADFRIAVGTAPQGIDFKAPDGHRIRLIVLFVIPKKHSNLYLHTLAQFLNLFGGEGNLQRVVQAKRGEDLIAEVDRLAGRPPVPSPPLCVTADTPLGRAVELLTANRVEALPVVDAEGNLVGELPALGLLRLGVSDPADAGSQLQEQAGTPLDRLEVIETNGYRTVQEEEPLADMALKLSQAGARAAYVLRGKKLVGRITVAEILKRISGGKA